jgi:hypothetical protein
MPTIEGADFAREEECNAVPQRERMKGSAAVKKAANRMKAGTECDIRIQTKRY